MLADVRRALLWLFALVGLASAVELPPTFLQSQIARGYSLQMGFRRLAPSLADALEGRTVDIARAQQEFQALPVDRTWALAMGNSAMGLIQEKASAGTGKVWLRESARLAERDLGVHWMLLLSQIHFGTDATFAIQLDGIEAAMLALGWQRLPEASSWLLATAHELSRANRPSTAALSLEAAIRLDPVSPVPPWSAAMSDIGRWELSSAYSHFAESMQRVATYPSAQEVVAFNLLRYLRYTLALTFLLILASWLVRYWPWITHQMAERLPRDTPLLARYLVLAAALVSLMVAGLGLLTFSFLAAFLLWRPAKRHERMLLGFLILFTGAQPWLAGLEGSLSRRVDRSSPEAIYQRVVEEGHSEELEATLDQAIATSSSADAHLLGASRAILLRKKESYLDALAQARQAYAPGLSDPRPLITLANMHFLAGHYDTAQALYEKARALDPDNPVIAFNLGQAYSHRGRLDSTALTFKNAQPVAQYRVDVHAHQNGRHFQVLPPNRVVLDAEASSNLAWASILKEFTSGEVRLGRWDLRTGVLDLPPYVLPWVAVALLVWLVVQGGKPPRRKVLFTCKTCGRVMCAHCRKGLHCVQCFRKLSTIEEVELRNELLERIDHERAHKTRLLRLGLDMAVPGTGRLMAAPGLLAFLQLLVFAAALGYALNLPNFLSLYPTSEALSGKPVAIGILLVFYALAGFQLVRDISRSTFAGEGK
jgi:tetratricopeptide (TPR) repeat protein